MKCSVVILNWNGEAMLRQYLPSVMAHTQIPDVEIVVADNGSTDDSVEWLKAEYPKLRLITFNKNHGFAEGYNQALKYFLTNQCCGQPLNVHLKLSTEHPQPPLLNRH